MTVYPIKYITGMIFDSKKNRANFNKGSLCYLYGIQKTHTICKMHKFLSNCDHAVLKKFITADILNSTKLTIGELRR